MVSDCLSVEGRAVGSLQNWDFGWLGLDCRVGSLLWARMCLVLGRFCCLIDVILALEGSDGEIS